jgi:hypothetical protein
MVHHTMRPGAARRCRRQTAVVLLGGGTANSRLQLPSGGFTRRNKTLADALREILTPSN